MRAFNGVAWLKEQKVCSDIDCLSMTRPDIVKRAGEIAGVELKGEELWKFNPKKELQNTESSMRWDYGRRAEKN
jgi:hypothetical protein